MALAISPRIRALMAPTLAGLEPYDPGFTPCEINLSANENSHGIPPELEAKLAEALACAQMSRYPDPLSAALRKEIAAWHGTAPDQVIVGNGGDELLYNLFLAFGGQGRKLVVSAPTFSVYKIYAQMQGFEVVEVMRDPTTMRTSEPELIAQAREAQLVVVTSPNNPTGDLASPALIDALCEACPGLVLADEAYIEFAPAGSSCLPALSRHANLMVLRTLSKAFAMAGCRCGYLIAQPDVIAALAAVRQPYSVNALTQAVAQVALENRSAFASSIEQIKGERSRLAAALAEIPGVVVWPSEANFLLVRLPHAAQIRARLRDEWSILVRDFSGEVGLGDCLRIAVGTHEENDRLLEAVKALVEEVTYA